MICEYILSLFESTRKILRRHFFLDLIAIFIDWEPAGITKFELRRRTPKVFKVLLGMSIKGNVKAKLPSYDCLERFFSVKTMVYG